MGIGAGRRVVHSFVFGAASDRIGCGRNGSKGTEAFRKTELRAGAIRIPREGARRVVVGRLGEPVGPQER